MQKSKLDAGKVFVYTLNSTLLASSVLTATNTLLDPNQIVNGRFGTALAAVGSQLAIGAPGDRLIAGKLVAGTAYVSNTDGTASRRLERSASELQHAGDQFGAAITTLGTSVVVGAPGVRPIGLVDVFTAGQAGKTKPDNISASGSITPPDGVVAWYSGDGDANDLQNLNNLNNGTVVGGTAIVAASKNPDGKGPPSGKAFQFDGIDDGIALDNDRNLGWNSRTFTISAWVKLDGNQQSRIFVSNYSQVGTVNVTRGWSLGISDSNVNKVKFFTSTDGAGPAPTKSLN